MMSQDYIEKRKKREEEGGRETDGAIKNRLLLHTINKICNQLHMGASNK